MFLPVILKDTNQDVYINFPSATKNHQIQIDII